MDDRGNLYENPTDEEIQRLKLIRLPVLPDRFEEDAPKLQPISEGASSRAQRRAEFRKAHGCSKFALNGRVR